MADLTPKQGVAWRLLRDDTHTEILYGGSAGGGKTRLGCVWQMASAIEYQGSRWLMGRAVLKTLKETTLKSFFDQCAEDGLHVGRDFTYNGQTNTLIFGRSEIMLKDMADYPSDPNFDELGSLELTGIFGDEVNQWSEKAKNIAISRIRYKLDQFKLVPKFLGTCNPAKNWTHRDFYKPWRDGTLAKHRAFVPALVGDNPHFKPIVLPDGTTRPHPYIESLMRMTGPDRERLLLGNWDYDDDPARLMDFDAISDLWTNHHVKSGAKYIVADIAGQGRDKTVISLWEGLRWVHTTTFDKNTGPEVVAAIQQLAKQEGVGRSHICIDSDGPGGMGVADYLPGCVRFNGGGKVVEVSGKVPNYQNLKAQCAYLLADHVNDRLVFIEGETHRDRISQELGHIKSYKAGEDGKMRILPKDDVIANLGHSPDYADVMLMRMVFELRGDAGFTRSMYNLADRLERKQRREAFGRMMGKR